ncbi:uncharacterized protein E1O_04010 [Burkholderiales bacterium GJ-E10]|nr:uncharacterized protein E1O_04010 [Burkholderiales bacterium GJ-E10]
MHGLRFVQGDPRPDGMVIPHLALRGCVAGIGGKAKTANSFRNVFRHAAAMQQRKRKIALRLDIPLFGGEAEPADGFPFVLADPFAIGVTLTEHALRDRIRGTKARSLCPFAEFQYREFLVLHTHATNVH